MLVNCKLCDKEFNKKPSQIKISPNNFCSASCAATYNNKNFPKRKVEGSCKSCNCAITTKHKFCVSCRGDRKRGVLKVISNNLKRKPLEGLISRDSIKNRIFETQEKYCESCGLHTWMDEPIMLELHHIDGSGKNNLRDNLQILCPNCHALTPTWRNRKR
jgi:hypothetical protein